jgi:hypothetical protein
MITGGFFGFMALVLNPSFLWSQPPEPPAKKMAIIAIFPLDSFGPNCRDGFLTAMHAETNIMPVMIDDVTIAEMKAGKTQLIDQHLRNAFATYNVLGVIGPPISEIAFHIASSVADPPHRSYFRERSNLANTKATAAHVQSWKRSWPAGGRGSNVSDALAQSGEENRVLS